MREAVRLSTAGNRRRWWLLVFGLAALSISCTLLHAPGWYIADARFEYFWSSGRYLTGHQWLWDGVRSLGKPSPYFAPAVAAVLATAARIGLTPATAERLLHGLYLLVAGVGMAAVLRLFRPRIGLEHLLAALVFMFSPYTTQFLLPSGLFLHYALAPWLFYVVARALRDDNQRQPWRWPSAFALLVFVVGSLNLPSLVYACIPLVPLTTYVVAVERRARWRDIVAFTGRAGILIAAGSIAMLMQLSGNARLLAENLVTTELPSTVSRTSSWAESWRGLGFWLSYFRTSTVLGRPEAQAYFTNPVVIAASFTVPCIALATLWRSRWRPRLLFAAVTVVALLLMIGLYPITRPAPVGSVLDTAYHRIFFLRGLRSAYKAGSGAAMGIAALFGVGVSDVVRRLRSAAPDRSALRRRSALAVPVAAIALVVAASFPFWTPSLYSASDRFHSVPEYWKQALRTVNELPGDGRVMILPGAARARYRWGYVGDDIFDALLSRPHVMRQSFSQGTAETGSLVVALDETATEDRYTPGSFAPLARELGIRWVLMRNDLAWEVMGTARPSRLAALRNDPALRLVASFGAAGQNTTSPDDGNAAALRETTLPAVELYEVEGAAGAIQARSAGPPLLVSGGGDALTALGATGTLAQVSGFRFTAGTSHTELAQALDAGAGVVVSDSNRRRVTQVASSHNLTSYTLAAGEELGRRPLDLFSAAGSQSVATFRDARRITASGYGSSLSRFENWDRPANAFDGDPFTAWLTAGAADAVGQWIRVDLTRPTDLGQLRLTPAPAAGSRRVAAVTITFSSGGPVTTAIRPDGETVVSFPARPVRWFEVRIERVAGVRGDPVGFSEITAPPLDLEESIQLPDDLFRAADRDPMLARGLARAPITYLFDRLIRLGAQDEELAVRRRFRIYEGEGYELSGTLRMDSSTPSAVLDGLQTDERCQRIATIDGAPVLARIDGSAADVRAGGFVAVSSCGATPLAAGWHELASDPSLDGLVEKLLLRNRPWTPRPGPAPTVRVINANPASATLRIDAPAGGTVVLGQSFAPGWRASVAGRDIETTALDSMSAWRLPGTGRFDLRIRYVPQQLYELGLAAMASCVALCAVLVLPRTRRPAYAVDDDVHDDSAVTKATRHVGYTAVEAIAVMSVGFLIGNLEGALLAGAAVVGARSSGPRLVGAMATFGLVATAVATLSVRLPNTSAGIAAFVDHREIAGIVGQLAAVLVAATVIVRGVAERSRRPMHSLKRSASDGLDRRLAWRARVWPTAIAGGVATLTAATVGTRSSGWPVFAVAVFAVTTVCALAVLEQRGTIGRRRAPPPPALATSPDQLVRGSVWLMAGFLVQALTGVAFWIVAARLDDAPVVGRATALFASLQFVNYATAMGLQEMLTRFTSMGVDDADRLFTWSVVITTVTSAIGTAGYLVVANSSSLTLSTIDDLAGALLFFTLSAGAAIALLVDARLMTARRWRWVFGRLVAVGAVRVPLLLLPPPVDRSLWLFLAIAAPIALSGAVGLVVLRREERCRYALRPAPPSARRAGKYAVVSYIAHLSLFAPQFALPVIVLVNVPATDNANFFVAWSMASVAFILPVTIGRVLLAEGSRAELVLDRTAVIALRLGTALMLLAACGTLALRPVIVAVYGSDYRLAAKILPTLVLGGIPWAVTAIALGRARVRHDHLGTVLMTATLAVTIIGAALVSVPRDGVDGAVRAWLVGTCISAVVAALLSLRRSRDDRTMEVGGVHA